MIKKIISFILIYCILIGLSKNFIYCKGIHSKSIMDLFIDNKIGTIVEKFESDSQDKYIIIQDLHCNIDIQYNIFNIIKSLKKSYGKNFKCIFTEGNPPQKLNDIKILNKLKNSKNKKLFLNHFFKKGDLTGAEIYNLRENNYLNIIGIENFSEYIKNFEEVYEMIQYQFTVEKIIKDRLNILYKKRNIFLNKESNEIINQYDLFEKNKISIVNLTLFLKKKYQKYNLNFENKYLEINKILYINNIEQKLDIKTLEIEKNNIIIASKNIFTIKETKTLKNYLAKNDFLFYKYLNFLIQKYNLDISKNFPAIDKYINYIEITNINYIEIIKELWLIKQEILEVSCNKNLSQIQFLFCLEFLTILQNQINSNISTVEINFLRNKNNYIKFFQLSSNFNLEIPVLIFQNYIEKFIKVYFSAEKRNEYFFKNISDFNKKHKNNKINIVIIGGYHTEGFRQILRNMNKSYIIITPKNSNKFNFDYKQNYTRKIHKLSLWIYKEKILNQNPIENNLLALPSTYLTNKEGINKYIENLYKSNESKNKNMPNLLTNIFIKLKNFFSDLFRKKIPQAWKEKKWESFGIFLYPIVLIVTLATFIVAANPITSFFTAALIILVSITILSIAIYNFSSKNNYMLRSLPKMIAMSAIIIGSFIFPANIIPLIIMAYILSDIFNSYQNLSNKTPESINFIFMFLYGAYLAIKIITMPIFGYFILGVAVLAIIYILSSYIKNSHAKNVLRAIFSIIAIILMIFHINNSNLKNMNSIVSTFSGFSNKFLPILNNILPYIFSILFPIWDFTSLTFVKTKLSNSPIPPKQHIFQTILHKYGIYLKLHWVNFYYEEKIDKKFNNLKKLLMPNTSLLFSYFNGKGISSRSLNSINLFFMKILNTILNKLPKTN